MFNSTHLSSIYFIRKNNSIPFVIENFDTTCSWDLMKTHLLNCCQVNGMQQELESYNVITSINQLLDLVEMKKLYYMLGTNVFQFIFLNCSIYFKWGQSAYILVSDFAENSTLSNDNNRRPIDQLNEDLETVQTGFDGNIPLKKYNILYDMHYIKNSHYLIPNVSIEKLSSIIFNQNVGQYIGSKWIFQKQNYEILSQLLSLNPTYKDCENILHSYIVKELNSVYGVQRFVSEIIEKYVPYKIFKSKKFFKKYLKNVRQLLAFNRNQNVTLEFLMKGVMPKHDSVQRNFASKFALWLLKVFVIKLIKTFFYVTEISKLGEICLVDTALCYGLSQSLDQHALRNEILLTNSLRFFLKEFWFKTQNDAYEDLITSNKLAKVENVENTSKVIQLRFLPKPSGLGLRPIMRKRNKPELELEYCNTFLKQLIATKYKAYPNPEVELHSAWVHFNKIRKEDTTFYYVKTDIMDAYGSILHEKLKTIIVKQCENLEAELKLVFFKIKDHWGRSVTLPHILNLNPAVSQRLQLDNKGVQVLLLTDIKRIIFEYIDNIYISLQTKKSSYRLTNGLHQGGKLSSVLCELYYLSLDDEYFSQFKISGDLFLRAVDDYILISSNKEIIKKFIEIALNGFPDYGVKVQIGKTVSNLESGFLNQGNISMSHKVEFFGYVLNIERGSITTGLKNYEGKSIKSCLTFKRIEERLLEYKICYPKSLKLQKILLDSSYQPMDVLYSNIHTSALVMVFKFLASMRFLYVAEIKLSNTLVKEYVVKGINLFAIHCLKKGIQYGVAKKLCLLAFIKMCRQIKYLKFMVNFLRRKNNSLKINCKRTNDVIKSVTKYSHPSLNESFKDL